MVGEQGLPFMGSFMREEYLNRLPVAIVKKHMTKDADAPVTLIYEQRVCGNSRDSLKDRLVPVFSKCILFKVGLLGRLYGAPP